jgi:hypothetical protein
MKIVHRLFKLRNSMFSHDTERPSTITSVFLGAGRRRVYAFRRFLLRLRLGLHRTPNMLRSRHADTHPMTHPRHHSSATREARCRSALLPAACQRVAARVVGVRAACELRFACTRRHTWRLPFRGSVVIGVCTHRVYSPSGQLDRAGGLVQARRWRGGAPLSRWRCRLQCTKRTPLMSLLILFGVEHERESTERERPLTLS